MDLRRCNRISPLRRPGGPRDVRRPVARRRPGCEPLDGRRLLSTAAATAPEFLVPPAAAVGKADSILESDAPADFAQFRTALARAEQHSDINQAEVNELAQDEAIVARDIGSAGLPGSSSAYDLRYVQDAVDFALTGSPGIHVGQRLVPLPQASQLLESKLSNAPAVLAVSPPTSISPIDQLINQVMEVARDATLPSAIQSALHRSYDRLSDSLGSKAIANLGPGETQRDALVVYYDGQVNKFLK